MALLRDPDVLLPSLTPLLQDRWSPRAFDPAHALSPDHLILLLEAARWAPSSGNSQPWSFVIGLRGDDTFGTIVQHLARGNSAWAGNASAILVGLAQNASGPDHELPRAGYAEYDLGQAVAHLSVQAHALDLHTHQFAGFDHDAVAAAFSVPSHWTVKVGIAVGALGDPELLDERTREKELAPRTRRPIGDFAFTGEWGATPVAVG